MSEGELMPRAGVRSCKLDLLHEFQASSRTRSGNSIGVDYGPATWRLEVETHEGLSPAEAAVWEAFLDRRRGRLVSFQAYRVGREGLLAAPGQDNVGLTLSAVNIATGQITLGGLDGMTISEGDLVSYRTLANGYWLGRVQTTVIGGVNTILDVSPAPQSPNVTSEIRVNQPRALFRLDPATVRTPQNAVDKRRSLAFAATQVVY